METVMVVLIIENERREILLLEEKEGEHHAYRFPSVRVLEKEGLSQAIQRTFAEETALTPKEIISYLGHRDEEKIRSYYFIGSAYDPYALEGQTTFGYCWVKPREGASYPISRREREMIDRYSRFCEGR